MPDDHAELAAAKRRYLIVDPSVDRPQVDLAP